jgi:hypothetical protein
MTAAVIAPKLTTEPIPTAAFSLARLLVTIEAVLLPKSLTARRPRFSCRSNLSILASTLTTIFPITASDAMLFAFRG